MLKCLITNPDIIIAKADKVNAAVRETSTRECETKLENMLDNENKDRDHTKIIPKLH